MIPIAEFHRRAMSGPVLREPEFDKAFSRKVREIVARYEIKYQPEDIIAGEELADAVFDGGVDLLADVGLYHKDTQRVIQLSKEEILQIAREAWEGPRKETFGKGKDAVTLQYRTAEDPRPPVIWFGNSGTPSSEELFVPWVQSFAQEELAQGIHMEGLVSFGGIQNKAGTPAELACGVAEIRMKQEVARRVGRPDMFLGGSSATSPGVIMTLCSPGLLERHNYMIPIHLMPELKLDWDRLLLAACAEERGIVPWVSAICVMGTLCRGPEDAAVAQVANLLGQLGYGHSTVGNIAAVTVDGGRTSREARWAYSAAARASERHIGVPIGASASVVAGAGTDMALYEKAAITLAAVASGNAWIWGSACRKGAGQNSTAGLEGRMVAETARAVAGMPKERANQVLGSILALYEEQLASPPVGKVFTELYDLRTIQPLPEYLALYQRAKERLAALGIPYA